jgi:hypothetical protein
MVWIRVATQPLKYGVTTRTKVTNQIATDQERKKSLELCNQIAVLNSILMKGTAVVLLDHEKAV